MLRNQRDLALMKKLQEHWEINTFKTLAKNFLQTVI